jgi:MoxR-like ATPase
MDRFVMKLSMGLPSKEEECKILERFMSKEPLKTLEPVLTVEDLKQAKEEIEKVFVHACVVEYMVSLAAATRNDESVLMGVSPRGTLALLHAAKAYAYLQGREFVTPDDVKHLAVPVLAHRIVMGYGKVGDGKEFMKQILATTPVPTEEFRV